LLVYAKLQWSISFITSKYFLDCHVVSIFLINYTNKMFNTFWRFINTKTSGNNTEWRLSCSHLTSSQNHCKWRWQGVKKSSRIRNSQMTWCSYWVLQELISVHSRIWVERKRLVEQNIGSSLGCPETMNASFIILSNSLYHLNIQHYITQESTKYDSKRVKLQRYGCDWKGR
jgi:hypothetical protein